MNDIFELQDNKTNEIVKIKGEDALKQLYKMKVSIPKNLPDDKKQDLKIKLSKLNNYSPLYDIYTDNMYLIPKKDVREYVFKYYYRMPTQKFIDELKNIKKSKEVNYLKAKRESNKQIDIKLLIMKDQLKRYNLFFKFLDNFDLNELLQTYLNILYQNESDKISLCRKPSFTPLLSGVIPYYTHTEIDMMAYNMNIVSENREYSNEEQRELCKKIKENDINANNLILHHNYIITNKSVGLIQYYSINGFITLNTYLRQSTIINKQLEGICKDLTKLIVNSPKLDKEYTLYRFIGDDSFISDLKVGDIFLEKGFLSTTRNPFYTQENLVFGWNLLKLKIKKNVPLLCIETISNFNKEEEVIFAPNTQLKLISKNNAHIYLHPDPQISQSIQHIYEFEIINTLPFNISTRKNIKETIVYNQNIPFDKLSYYINEINFLKLDNTTIKPYNNIIDKILAFRSNYTNEFNQFYTRLGNDKILVTIEKYNSKSIYREYYRLRTNSGIMFYCMHKNHMLFIIEFDNDKLLVNYGSKFNTYLHSQLCDDNDLLKLVAEIAYYFNIFNVIIYCNYFNCDYFTDNSKLNEDSTLKYIHYSGVICTDFYNYITKKQKRFNNTPSNIINPRFNYNVLDYLETIKINKSFFNKKYMVLRYLFTKIYTRYYKTDLSNITLKDFYLWLCENNCYYIKYFIKSIVYLPQFKANNPFENDYYVFYPMTYLYNNKLINYLPVIQSSQITNNMRDLLISRLNDPREYSKYY